MGSSRAVHTLDWPPIHLLHLLAYRVKRVHCGEVRLRGPNGEVLAYAVDLAELVEDDLGQAAAPRAEG